MFTFLMPARRRMVLTPQPVRSCGITQAAAREAVVRRRSCTRVKYMCVILFVGIQVASCSTQPRETRQENSTAMFHRLSLRSEEHTSELQSLTNLVCRLLLE